MNKKDFVVIIPLVDPKFVDNMNKLLKLLNHTLSNIISQKHVDVHILVMTTIPQKLLKPHQNITYLLLHKSNHFKNITQKPVIHTDKLIKYLIGIHYCKKYFDAKYIIPMDADDIFMNDCFHRINKLPHHPYGYVIDKGYQMVTHLPNKGHIKCLNVNHSLAFNKMCGSCRFFNPNYLYKKINNHVTIDTSRIRDVSLYKYYHINDKFENMIQHVKDNKVLTHFIGNHINSQKMANLSKIFPLYYPAIKLSCHTLNNSRIKHRRQGPIYLDGHTKPIKHQNSKIKALKTVKMVLRNNRLNAI